MSDPTTYFSRRGWMLRFREADGVMWADLVSRRKTLLRRRPAFVAAAYGRGHDEESAAQAALARWQSEQGI